MKKLLASLTLGLSLLICGTAALAQAPEVAAAVSAPTEAKAPEAPAAATAAVAAPAPNKGDTA
jgi:hypothetical protein